MVGVVAVTLTLKSPVSEKVLDSIHPGLMYVQFSSALTDADYAAVAERLASCPTVRLRAFGSYDGSITNLDFLRHFPFLRAFEADVYDSLTDIEGLVYLPPDTRHISLGRTRKRMSLAVLDRFRQLQRLHLDGHTKDIEVLDALGELHTVVLRSITLPDLSLLVSLRKLRVLALHLGGTKDLDLLPGLKSLEYLELWMVKGLADLSAIADLGGLEYLFLQSLRQVEALPPMGRLTGLRRLWIETMKGLTDLSPIRDAPNLHQLAVVDMAHLQPEAFEPLVGHPALTGLRYGLGSQRKNDAVARIIHLPDAGGWRRPL